jgi:hypothetical protein
MRWVEADHERRDARVCSETDEETDVCRAYYSEVVLCDSSFDPCGCLLATQSFRALKPAFHVFDRCVDIYPVENRFH